MSENPLLKTPGELINEARQSQDLTIAQLSERTKIPPPVLTALELDEYHKISGPLYIKSFLRTCALDLGLDPETVLSLYNKISGETQSRSQGTEMIWEDDQVQVSHVGLPWVKIIMIAGVVVTLLGVGLFALRGCGNENEAPFEPVTSKVDPAALPEEGAQPVSVEASPEEVSGFDSLMTSPTEEDLSQSSAVGQEGELVEAEPPQATFSPDDAVAIAPMERVTEPAVVPETPAEEPEVRVPRPEPTYVDQIESAWPLVLRIVCDSPQEILVKRDGENSFQKVRWPTEQETAPVVPEAEFEAGRAYRQNEHLVVFWGADDHFSLKLARVRGVEVSINGRAWDIGRLRPGKEIILDAHSAGATERR